MGDAQARVADQIGRRSERLRNGASRLGGSDPPIRRDTVLNSGQKKSAADASAALRLPRVGLALLAAPAPDDGVLDIDVGLRRAENLGQVDRLHGSGVGTAELKQLEGLLEDRQ